MKNVHITEMSIKPFTINGCKDFDQQVRVSEAFVITFRCIGEKEDGTGILGAYNYILHGHIVDDMKARMFSKLEK